MAVISLGNKEDALDTVQEAMLQLVARYARKPAAEWKPLFYRILHNKINDLHRRNNVRSRFKGWLSNYRDQGEEIIEDPFQTVPDPAGVSPERQHANAQQIMLLESALHKLPSRQQQAFMLRCWEGLSTAETALAMRCSEGSVKTHYFRALNALRASLDDNQDYRGDSDE